MLGYRCEHVVAGHVAIPIVDLFEVVDVEHEQRQWRVVPSRESDLGRQAIEEVTLVEGPREAVVQSRVVHLLLEVFFQLVAVRKLQDRRRAHLDLVAVVQEVAIDASFVDERSVRTLQVLDPELVVVLDDASVLARYAVILEPDAGVRRAPDHGLGLVDAEHLPQASARQNDEVCPVATIRDFYGGQVTDRRSIFVALFVVRVPGHPFSVLKILNLWSTRAAPPVKGRRRY